MPFHFPVSTMLIAEKDAVADETEVIRVNDKWYVVRR
jgi:hypothetical protein